MNFKCLRHLKTADTFLKSLAEELFWMVECMFRFSCENYVTEYYLSYRFMVMTSVGIHLETKKHGLKGTLKILQDVAVALKFSHDRCIFYCDISYLNIMYKRQGYLINWASNDSALVNSSLTVTYLFSSILVCFIHISFVHQYIQSHTVSNLAFGEFQV